MTADQAQEIASFIKTAELDDTFEGALLADAEIPPLSESVSQAAVVDSNIVTFPAGTPMKVREAVADWLLFAQRVANKQVSNKEHPEDWTEVFYRTLTATGWVVREDATAWTEEGAFGFTVHQKIMQLVAVVLGPIPAALAIVTAALTSLDQMDDDSPWITLFDRRGRSAKSVGFQVANCDSGSTGSATLRAIDFLVHAESTMTQVLFFRFTATTARMAKRGQILELPATTIDQHGPAISERVQALTGDAIKAFDLDLTS